MALPTVPRQPSSTEGCSLRILRVYKYGNIQAASKPHLFLVISILPFAIQTRVPDIFSDILYTFCSFYILFHWLPTIFCTATFICVAVALSRLSPCPCWRRLFSENECYCAGKRSSSHGRIQL